MAEITGVKGTAQNILKVVKSKLTALQAELNSSVQSNADEIVAIKQRISQIEGQEVTFSTEFPTLEALKEALENTNNGGPAENGILKQNVVYLVPSSTEADTNVKDEYIVTRDPKSTSRLILEGIGTTSINLGEYYTKHEVDTKISAEESARDEAINAKSSELQATIDQIKQAIGIEGSGESSLTSQIADIKSSIDSLNATTVKNSVGNSTVNNTINGFKAVTETTDNSIGSVETVSLDGCAIGAKIQTVSTEGQGARVITTKNGAYYTSGKSNDTFTAGEEIATYNVVVEATKAIPEEELTAIWDALN